MRVLEIYSLSEFTVFDNSVINYSHLAIYYISSVILLNWNFVPFDQHLPFSLNLPAPGNHYSILYFYVFDFFRFHM